MTSGKVLKAGQESGGHATTLRLPACGGEKARPEGQRPKDLAGAQVWFTDGRLALAAAASAPDATGPGRPKKIDPKLHGRTPGRHRRAPGRARHKVERADRHADPDHAFRGVWRKRNPA